MHRNVSHGQHSYAFILASNELNTALAAGYLIGFTAGVSELLQCNKTSEKTEKE